MIEQMNSNIVAFKKQLENSGTKGLVIDLDETLSWTIHYMAGELAKRYGNPQNLSVEELRERMIAHDVPFWNVEEIRKWGLLALESEEMTEEYPIIEGSDKAVEKIDHVILVVGYLTLRQTSIRDATKRWLKKHGFPDAPVITRPNNLKLEEGMKWKADTLAYLYPQVIGLIDDTLDIFNYLPGSYKGTIFLYGQTDYPKSDLNIIPCKTWDDVYKKVVEHKASLG
ncbi:hypothetical protein [Clostridium sp. BJN0013]|uniref:hypothetical protein n=1 Tax=Clostridium sp. BJN0013 TaxID=3236840 RepID=UPI0034C611F7